MALQELKVLGDEMSSVFLNDPYHTNPTDRLQGLQSIFTSFKDFALNLKEHILGMGAGGPLLSEALFTLESDYSHHSITLAADDSTQHMEDAISRFQSYGQHEFAHILLLKRFLGLNEITNDDTHRFIQSRKQFLDGCKDVLQSYGLEEPVAVILLNSQMYLPRKLLQIPDISNHVLEIGFHDCLGRSVSHVLSDAGNVVNWPRNPGHDADLLGRTALYTACYKGDEALTKDLIASRRADLKYQAKNGLTPLHIAACMGHTSICDIIWDACTPREFHDLLRDRSGRSPLLWAALRGHQSTVARLCKLITHLFPLDIESLAAADKDNFASTAVILATCGGHIEVVQYLLSCNDLVARFPVDEVDLRGHTAMEYAKQDSNTRLVALLRKAGRVHQENVVASGFSYLMDFNEYDGAGFNFPSMFTKP
jgi:ankyrin repeat protein